jgi:hypothetical protein
MMHFSLSSTNGFSCQGKLHICDLAGFERLGKSSANSVSRVSVISCLLLKYIHSILLLFYSQWFSPFSFEQSALLKETQKINSSLSTLSNVIEKLQSGSPHVPTVQGFEIDVSFEGKSWWRFENSRHCLLQS